MKTNVAVRLHLKDRLREHLKERSWTAAELSRRSGVPKQVLSLWLAGVEPRKLSHLKSVASVLGTSIDQLCFAVNPAVVAGTESPVSEWIEGVFEGRLRIARNK